MSRHFLWILVISAVAILVSVTFFIKPTQSAATLVMVSGQADVDPSGGILLSAEANPILVQSGQAVRVSLGRTIHLQPNAIAQIIFEDGTFVEFSDGAEIRIDEFTSTQDTFRVRIHLLAGKTINRVKRLLGAKDIYEISTPSSTISVRGTWFSVEVIDPLSTFIACFEGVVHVVTGDQEVDLHAGEQLLAKLGEKSEIAPSPNIPTQALPTQVQMAAPTTNSSTPSSRPPLISIPTSTSPLVTPQAPLAPTIIPSDEVINNDANPPPAPPSSEGDSDSTMQVPGKPPQDTKGNPPSGGAEPHGHGGEPPGQNKKKP